MEFRRRIDVEFCSHKCSVPLARIGGGKPVPPSINDEELEVNICKALSLTGHEVKPDDLQACRRLKKKSQLL